MKFFRPVFFTLLAACLSFAPSAQALPDQYSGDTSIYEGVAQDVGRPNILFIIDNSQSTTNTVADDVTFMATTVYDPGISSQGDDCTGVNNPGKECWLPWNIYKQDNQGDFATLVMENTDYTLSTLVCDPSNDNTDSTDDNSDYIRTFFQQYGSYSGSGAATFPNLNGNGTCDYGITNTSGTVYALGNYLNYLKNATPADGGGDTGGGCTDETPATIIRADEYKNGAWNTRKFAYFKAINDHTSSADPYNSPYNRTSTDVVHWEPLPTSPPPANFEVWAPGQEYTKYTCNDVVADPPTVGTAANISQREVVFNTLKDVVLQTGSLVNFGAMVYGSGTSSGSNNSGGSIVASMANLSVDVTTNLDGDYNVIVAPDCDAISSANWPPYCQFIKGIPGPPSASASDPRDCINYTGAGCLPSNTARPQAEALFDAGYYFGADYTSITNNMQIAPEDSPCDLNHIILITNGFSNGDGSPNLDVIGDADGDHYENEEAYGLGSHWLDDVARYLKANHKVTTHTVLAFQAYDDLVANAAKDGGGQFHLASNEAQLREALIGIIGSIINEKSTSFVAPVVPASTTNRTISSNRVYLGLFKPQADGPWYGNVKKYGLTADRRLAEPPVAGSGQINGTEANYPDGSFDPDSVSFWSVVNGIVPSSNGDIDPSNTDPNEVKGDGGEVDSGGIGGVLLKRTQAWSTAIKTGASTTGLSRNIFTFLPDGSGGWTKEAMLPTNADISAALLGLPDTTRSWWLTAASPDGLDSFLLTPAENLNERRRRNLIRYTLGFDSLNVQAGETIYDVRKWVMGDVLHSRPVVFNYTQYGANNEFTCSENPDADGNYNSSIIFVGANDGMLHAFRDCDGKELWGFVPDNVLDNLKYLPEIKHTSYLDSPPSILFYDKDDDGNVDVGTVADPEDLVVLVVGQRRGGGMNNLTADSRGSFYALNITDVNNPSLMWKLDTSDYDELAETWSLATIKRVKVAGSTDIRFVAFVSAGYDNNEDLRHGVTQTFPNGTDDTTNINVASSGGSVDGLDGSGNTLLMTSSGTDADGHNMRGRAVAAILVAQLSQQTVTDPNTGTSKVIYVPQTQAANASIGTVIWSSKNNLPSGYSAHPYSFASDLTTLDLNNNGGYIDRVYATDTGGNLWRFDTTDRNPANWTAEIMFSANSAADANVGRKFFYPPSVAVQNGQTWVCFNSGDREHPLNLPVVDRLYCIKDYYNKYDYASISGFENHTTADAVNESDLVDVTENVLQSSTASTAEISVLLGKLHSTPINRVDSSTGAPDDSGDFYYGWFIKLDGKDRILVTGDYGEKALAAPVIFQGEVFFSTYQIKTGSRSNCEAGNLGYSRLYRVDLGTGEAVYNYDTNNDTESTTLNDRAAGAEGEVLRRSDRVYQLGEGIPSGIVQVVDAAGNVSLLISSSDKVEGIGGSNPTMTFPLYWIQW